MTTTIYFIAFSAIALLIAVSVIFIIYSHTTLRIKNIELESQAVNIASISEALNNAMEVNAGLSLKLSFQDAEIKRLERDVTGTYGKNEKLQVQIQSLLATRFSTINKLCNDYFEIGQTDNHKIALYKSVEKEIKTVCTRDNIEKIEQIVNECCDGAMAHIREGHPDLKDDDYAILTLSYAGFQPKAICLFTGMKLKTFYTRRSRLQKRISSSSRPQNRVD